MTDAETRVTDPVTGGMKGKKLAELGALDPLALLQVAKVAGYGGQKYERLNYMKGYAWSLSFDAMQRHLLLFWSGEDTDEESGLPHLAHAAWHCLTLLAFVGGELGTDDRYKPPPSAIDRIMANFEKGFISQSTARAAVGVGEEAIVPPGLPWAVGDTALFVGVDLAAKDAASTTIVYSPPTGEAIEEAFVPALAATKARRKELAEAWEKELATSHWWTIPSSKPEGDA